MSFKKKSDHDSGYFERWRRLWSLDGRLRWAQAHSNNSRALLWSTLKLKFNKLRFRSITSNILILDGYFFCLHVFKFTEVTTTVKGFPANYLSYLNIRVSVLIKYFNFKNVFLQICLTILYYCLFNYNVLYE